MSTHSPSLACSPRNRTTATSSKDVRRSFRRDKPILPGQLYAILGRLARDAAIAKIDDTGISGGPERTRYAVTDVGHERLLAWLRQPEARLPRSATLS
ncbi:PadR family transcriptional regulator [Trueperella pyogenes]|uniref:PadR family transcriptional regulator n=1 Tax=Trueperella pyogenes TaxID=1661 RepID=UPI001FD85892|nr:helix-turn-helix transcriptional regulator [Trueperella pyogenes]